MKALFGEFRGVYILGHKSCQVLRTLHIILSQTKHFPFIFLAVLVSLGMAHCPKKVVLKVLPEFYWHFQVFWMAKHTLEEAPFSFSMWMLLVKVVATSSLFFSLMIFADKKLGRPRDEDDVRRPLASYSLMNL